MTRRDRERKFNLLDRKSLLKRRLMIRGLCRNQYDNECRQFSRLLRTLENAIDCVGDSMEIGSPANVWF